jgi:DNA-binding NarL/FixJ family response regulator
MVVWPPFDRGKSSGMTARRALVAVVSPQPVVVEGLVAMLGHHHDRIEVVDGWVTPSDIEPDVVLYDVLGLVEGDGSDLAQLVKETAAVVFAVGRDLRPDLLSRALAQGADGFFSLGVSEDELLAAVESAMTGWLPGDAAPDPVVGSDDSVQRAQRLGTDAGLTPREVVVLSLITQGLSNDAIARREFLSINSVKTYIRSAYRKIGVASRTQAVVWALQHGFEPHEEDRSATVSTTTG